MQVLQKAVRIEDWFVEQKCPGCEALLCITANDLVVSWYVWGEEYCYWGLYFRCASCKYVYEIKPPVHITDAIRALNPQPEYSCNFFADLIYWIKFMIGLNPAPRPHKRDMVTQGHVKPKFPPHEYVGTGGPDDYIRSKLIDVSKYSIDELCEGIKNGQLSIEQLPADTRDPVVKQLTEVSSARSI